MNSIEYIYLQTLFYDLVLSILDHKIEVFSCLFILEELFLSLRVYFADLSVLQKQTLRPARLLHTLLIYELQVVSYIRIVIDILIGQPAIPMLRPGRATLSQFTNHRRNLDLLGLAAPPLTGSIYTQLSLLEFQLASV